MEIKIIQGGMLGTNSYLIEKDKKAIVFDFTPEVELYTIEHDIEIEKVFLTHIHFDHIEGLGTFQKNNKFEIVLSSFAATHINNSSYNLLSHIDRTISQSVTSIEKFRFRIFDNSEIIQWKDVDIRCLLTPGHSKCSSSYIIDELNAVICGDLIFKSSIGRTDLPGSDYSEMKNSIEKILLLEKNDKSYQLYPGHGDITSIRREKTVNPYL